MLNESPDSIKDVDQSTSSYGDPYSVTFALFNNFTIYGESSICTHNDLYIYILYLIGPPSDVNWNDSHKSFAEIHEIKHIGKLSEEEKNKFQNTGLVERGYILEKLPYVIQGRLWKKSEIISFWNDATHISNRKKDILEFIRLIGGNTHKYKYEIKDKLYNYDDFISGEYSDNLKFDRKSLHTLPPEKKGVALRQMGYQPKTPIPLNLRQMNQAENLNFKGWLLNEEIEFW